MSIENIRIKTDIDNLVHLYAYPEQFDAFVKAGGGDVEGWTLESLV